MKSPQTNNRSGFTLLEVVLSAAILGVLARSLVSVSAGMSSLSNAGGSLSLLQEQATKAQEALLGDLRQSGLMMVDGLSYPHVFEGGAPGVGFGQHAYVPGIQQANANEADFGAHRAVIFLEPADMDGDGRPDMDLDLNGIPELDVNRDGVLSEDAADIAGWDANLYRIDPVTGLVWDRQGVRYAVLNAPDGRTYLERWVGGVLDRRVAKDVERFFVETPLDTGFQIPTNALRVSLFLRRTDSDGVTYRHSAQWVVSLKNGELE
ncbi:MAG: prepilin-type N-terminal cleavage/methylation domain-containing protein [Planctomycetota bacterium]|jgi:prepilin-type N-terminal cleavage/methylation domain-containing protein